MNNIFIQCIKISYVIELYKTSKIFSSGYNMKIAVHIHRRNYYDKFCSRR